MRPVGAYQTGPRSQAATFEDNPSLHLVGGFPETIDMKKSTIMLIHGPHSQSYPQLPEFVPSRHRERRPYRKLGPAASGAELKQAQSETWHGVRSPSRYILIARVEDPVALNAYMRTRKTKRVIIPHSYWILKPLPSPAGGRPCLDLAWFPPLLWAELP
jgi:hypothetical protein